LLTNKTAGFRRVKFAETLTYMHQRKVLAKHAKFNLALPY